MRWLVCWLPSVLLLAAGPALAQMPAGEYLEAKGAKVAVVLAHGRGLSPDGNVVGPLRRALHEQLGVHTLSLQMPSVPSDDVVNSSEIAPVFPEAYQRIQAAIDFLKKDQGVERVYLMGHSMGGRMASGFLANQPDTAVVGFIGVGLIGGGKEPVNTNLNLRKLALPVIDVYAEGDFDLKSAEARKPLVSERYVQVPVPGAKHDYKGYERPVADAVAGWIKKQEGR